MALYNKLFFGSNPVGAREVWSILYKHVMNTRGQSYTFHVRIPMIDPDTGMKKVFFNWASKYNLDLIAYALKNADPDPRKAIEIVDVAKEKEW